MLFILNTFIFFILILKGQSLTCPSGSEQVGNINADIGGCGLTSCNDRYNYANINSCQSGCENFNGCIAYTWAPLGGDQNHLNEKVCTFYNNNIPNQQWAPNQIFCKLLECPAGSEQIGSLNADIAGCGLTSCGARYNYNNINECQSACESFSGCTSYTWAPLGGDQNHLNEKVCTFYNSNIPNRQWAPNQIMCGLLQCPFGSEQIGVLNSDIAGCGLTSCNARYNYANINSCQEGCEDLLGCKSYTYAPLGGDQNHVNERVCTFYNSNTPNQLWSPNQIMCGLALECPSGTLQVGPLNSDIAGCGLTSCSARYSYNNINDCRQGCENFSGCVSFSWAPLGGDQNHVNEKVCTFYNSNVPNQLWAPNQILCKL